MTTISLGAPATRLRLTVRGRRVLAAAAAVPAAAIVGYAVLSGGAALASHSVGAPIGSFETVIVESGDSLWSIAQDVAPAADPRDVVDGMIRLNALDGATIAVGDELAVPTEFGAR